MINQDDARAALDFAWPTICAECREVLGSELHYQAMIYHALRTRGRVPVRQLGMNVKQEITDVRSVLFQALDLAKHPSFRGGFEPIPDIVLFSPEIEGDWRRRRAAETIRHMLVVIEVKASERHRGRLGRAEIIGDIRKLVAHREEANHQGYDFHPIMMVIDTAPLLEERMTEGALSDTVKAAASMKVGFRYVGRDMVIMGE